MKSEVGYRCWAEIDLAALRANARFVRDRLGADVELLAVVKANGYGHGMLPVATALANDVQLFGVANLEEASMLREEVAHPIIVLGPALSKERVAIVRAGFIPSVSTYDEANEFSRVAESSTVAINLVIDTGMGRMGVMESDALSLFRKISQLPNMKIHSISTHLPAAEDADFTHAELRQFTGIVEKLRKEFNGSYKAHALPSAGVLGYGNMAFDIVRAGLILYGIAPLPGFDDLLRPVMTWKTRIALIRDVPAGHGISYGRTFVTPRKMRVATLSAGYADGYPRHLSNRDASVLVRGKRCPLLGRVTMDLMMIDVSHVDAEIGDEVVLMGRQGDESISAVELADRINTIAWEIVARIGSRVQRIYV